MKIIDPSELPPPETLVQQVDGSVLALMFHFAPEEYPYCSIACEHGFRCTSRALENDDQADLLWEDYEAGGTRFLAEWRPSLDGWVLGGIGDGEDGPFAIFIRPDTPESPA